MTYGGRAPFVKGSETSEDAADSIESVRHSIKEKVRRFFVHSGIYGATDDEIELSLRLRHQTASARRRELELSGHIVKTGRKRPTRSGRSAGVYRISHIGG